MSLPYQDTSSGKRAIEDIQKILKSFGCKKFATGEDFDTGEVFIQFEHRGQMISMSASAQGYASAWLKENPWSSRRRLSPKEHEKKALDIGSVAVYSMLRDWVKGQVTLIECGILTFQSAFLSHLVLPNGKRVIEELNSKNMLPSPENET